MHRKESPYHVRLDKGHGTRRTTLQPSSCTTYRSELMSGWAPFRCLYTHRMVTTPYRTAPDRCFEVSWPFYGTFCRGQSVADGGGRQPTTLNNEWREQHEQHEQRTNTEGKAAAPMTGEVPDLHQIHDTWPWYALVCHGMPCHAHAM